MAEEKLEYVKMRERIEFADKELSELAKKKGLKVSDDILFAQINEMARCLFVRSEIAYSGKR